MIHLDDGARWHAIDCLKLGFKNGLFERRMADGLVVCATDQDSLVLPIEQDENRTEAPTEASLSRQTQAGIDLEATIIPKNMRGSGGSARSPSTSVQDSRS